MRGTIQGKNRVREQRQHGSVRGVPGNRHPYRDRFFSQVLNSRQRAYPANQSHRFPRESDSGR